MSASSIEMSVKGVEGLVYPVAGAPCHFSATEKSRKLVVLEQVQDGQVFDTIGTL